MMMPNSRFAVVPGLPASVVPHICPPKPALSGVEGSDVGRTLRRWKVIHACAAPEKAAAVAQAQIEAGMRASLLSPDPGASAGCPTSARLWQMWALQSFREVRIWRRLLAAEAAADHEILHTHCFAAGVAAVLSGCSSVYDFDATAAPSPPAPRQWLLRRAENFALTRAAAVVVHSQAMWSEALRRGVPVEDLFLVADPVEPLPESPARAAGGSRRERAAASRAVLFVPGVSGQTEAATVLDAFTLLAAEIEGAQLWFEAEGELAEFVICRAQEREIASAVRVIAPLDSPRALAEADLVIAGSPDVEEPSRVALAAFAHGRALLAADVPQNREVTPQGAGCVWYRPGDARDLACRAAFLARNPDFRAALAAGGRAHLAATRGPAVVARRYDEVYRHAFHKRSGGSGDIIGQLQVVQAAL